MRISRKKLPFVRIMIMVVLFSMPGITVHAQNQDEARTTITSWLEEGAELFGPDADPAAVIEFYGKKQLGIEYVGGLLDENPVETLVVTLEGSDCVLYVENSYALALTTLQESRSWDRFADNLKLLRYRDGKIDGYNSRLHYFSDWMKTNQEKGLIEVLHQETGLPVVNQVQFMSANRDAYPRLAESDSLFYLIATREAQLRSHRLYYIPTEKITEYEKNWKTGDLLGFVSTIDGLDIAHTALVHRDGDRLGFYHASTVGEVMKDPKTIYEYTRDRRNVKGVVVARPLFQDN
jgi:hypothetical protein